MPKRNLLIALLIVILTGGITAADLYIGKKFNQPQEEPLVALSAEPKQTTREITPTEPSEIDISKWKTYRNEEYGFELTFPNRWEGYKVSESISETRPPIKAICFNLKHTSGEYRPVFCISIYSDKNEWEWIQSQEGPKPTYLSESKIYIFAYSMGHDDEGFAGFPKVTPGFRYQGPFYDVENKIIPTFELIKNNEIVP